MTAAIAADGALAHGDAVDRAGSEIPVNCKDKIVGAHLHFRRGGAVANDHLQRPPRAVPQHAAWPAQRRDVGAGD